MEYYLYPPFFVNEPEPSFDDGWEAFCCELLNLENHTNAIRRRTPPDLGCDLIWDEKKVAYQCKAVESGQVSKLNLSKVKESIETAIAYKDIVGWDRYVLCTNVNLTGDKERKIRDMLPNIEFLSLTYWRALCKKYPSISDSRCRQLVPIPRYAAVRAIDEVYLENYAGELQNHLNTEPITLFVYSNRRKEIFKLPVSSEFTIDNVLEILIKVFKLPEPRKYEDIKLKVSISYSLVIDDKAVPLTKKLNELSLSLGKKPLVTFWKTIVWSDEQGQTKETVMELTTMFSALRYLPTRERSHIAIERFKQEIDAGFDQAVAEFLKRS